MFPITVVSVLATAILVLASHLDVGAQLCGLGLALALGAGVAARVLADARLDALAPRHILWLGAGLRLLSLFAQPVLEDDHFRYLWDGYRFAVSGTPYGAAPSAFFDDASVPAPFQQILNDINYPDIPTIYGPVLELLFLAGHVLAPGKIGALQALDALADTGLLLMLVRCGAAPRALLLYAVSPLVLMESVMTAHPDGLLGLLAVAALAWARRAWLRGALMGLAVAAKVPALLLLAFLLRRGGLRALAGAALTLVLCYLPLWLQPGSELPALSSFARLWHFNPLLFLPVEALAGARLARPAAGLLLVAGLALLYWRDLGKRGPPGAPVVAAPPLPPVDLALGALLALAPVVNPWYLLWLLPFAVLRPSRTALAASFVLPLSYWNSSNGAHLGRGQFDLPPLVTLIELAVLGACAWWDWRRPLASHRHWRATPAVR